MSVPIGLPPSPDELVQRWMSPVVAPPLSVNSPITNPIRPRSFYHDAPSWLVAPKVCPGVVPRNEHEKTKRTTNRSETGLRQDGLGFNGAKRFVSAQTVSQDPTRFKSDRNDEQYNYNNQAQPGITNFRGAYTNSVAAQVTSKTNEELMKYGFAPKTVVVSLTAWVTLVV